MPDTEPDPARWPRPLEELLDSVLAPLRSLAGVASTASARLGTWYTEHEDAVVEALQTFTFIGVAAARPENWEELQPSEVLRLHQVALADQLCLVWVPRGDIVRELLRPADRDQRRLVLVARLAEILDDCESAITAKQDVESPVYADICKLTLKSMAAARDGHYEAAQALAGSVLTAIIHEILAFDRQADARKEFKTICSEADLRLFMLREMVLYGATAQVLARTSEGLPGFNRHATAHGHVDRFDCADMLEAIMLTSAWLREIAFQNSQMKLREHTLVRPQPSRYGVSVRPNRDL